jgi:hypothetical protein
MDKKLLVVVLVLNQLFHRPSLAYFLTQGGF